LTFLQQAIQITEGNPVVFNMDEMGHHFWADRTEKNMFCPVFPSG
jgi:hypothetical protein